MLKRVFFSYLWVFYGSLLSMAVSDSNESSRELDQTPTWAVAAVCTVFILISIALEKSLHKLGTVCN
jgi:mlo protein